MHIYIHIVYIHACIHAYVHAYRSRLQLHHSVVKQKQPSFGEMINCYLYK